MATHLLRILLFTLTAILIWPSPAPAQRAAVLVNPHVQGNGTAKTIQEGIGMVDPGGKVMVLPGTYNEAIVIDKGLTLEAVGGESDSVIVAPSGAPVAAVLVATSDPVTIRDLTIHFSGANGIRGDGVVDVIAERIRVRAVNPPLGAGSLVTVINNAMTGRARLAVRESFLDGALPPANSPTPPFPQVFGIRVQGDVDALFEGNVIRRTGGACISVAMRSDFGGETNADILENDLDECYPLLRAGSLIVQAAVVPTAPVTATGVVNIIGNTIRNTFASCLPTTAITQSFAPGRIERNRILGVVQPCAIPISTRNPGAIWIGSLFADVPPVSPLVRFNDIEGNAHAGLRVAPNITTPLDARCNWWGSAGGPSVGTDPLGSDIVVEPGATTPEFTPWASAPIAETDEIRCTGGTE